VSGNRARLEPGRKKKHKERKQKMPKGKSTKNPPWSRKVLTRSAGSTGCTVRRAVAKNNSPKGSPEKISVPGYRPDQGPRNQDNRGVECGQCRGGGVKTQWGESLKGLAPEEEGRWEKIKASAEGNTKSTNNWGKKRVTNMSGRALGGQQKRTVLEGPDEPGERRKGGRPG